MIPLTRHGRYVRIVCAIASVALAGRTLAAQQDPMEWWNSPYARYPLTAHEVRATQSSTQICFAGNCRRSVTLTTSDVQVVEVKLAACVFSWVDRVRTTGHSLRKDGTMGTDTLWDAEVTRTIKLSELDVDRLEVVRGFLGDPWPKVPGFSRPNNVAGEVPGTYITIWAKPGGAVLAAKTMHPSMRLPVVIREWNEFPPERLTMQWMAVYDEVAAPVVVEKLQDAAKGCTGA